MNLSKIDWWKANAYWMIYGGILFWSKNFSSLGDTQVLGVVTTTSLLGILFIYGLLKHSKIVFWISFISFVASIIELVIANNTLNSLDSQSIFNYIISTILTIGLAWQVLFNKGS